MGSIWGKAKVDTSGRARNDQGQEGQKAQHSCGLDGCIAAGLAMVAAWVADGRGQSGPPEGGKGGQPPHSEGIQNFVVKSVEG